MAESSVEPKKQKIQATNENQGNFNEDEEEKHFQKVVAAFLYYK